MRESLGLTAQWLADRAGVRLRTVQYWEAGRAPVPADVSILVTDIERTIARAVASALRVVDQQTKRLGAPPECVDLRRYATDAELHKRHPDMIPLPVTCHAAMLARTARALGERGIRSKIEYAN